MTIPWDRLPHLLDRPTLARELGLKRADITVPGASDVAENLTVEVEDA